MEKEKKIILLGMFIIIMGFVIMFIGKLLTFIALLIGGYFLINGLIQLNKTKEKKRKK